MTILAKSLELLPGTALLGPGGTIIVQTTGDIRLRPSSAAPCRIDVADPTGADRIELLSTTGTIEIGGVVDARGTNTDGFGGSIDITGASVLVSGIVRTSGGNLGSSGPILIDALTGGILLSATGAIEGFGGSGSVLELTAETTITTTGRVDIRATAAGGDGGTYFVLTNAGSVSLGGKVFMQGDEGQRHRGRRQRRRPHRVVGRRAHLDGRIRSQRRTTRRTGRRDPLRLRPRYGANGADPRARARQRERRRQRHVRLAAKPAAGRGRRARRRDICRTPAAT